MIKKKAFTLIELLVVVSIIALLVAILMPALGKAREQAKTSVCLNNNRTLRQALDLYFADNDGKFLPYSDPVGGQNLWMRSIAKTIDKVSGNRFCPSAPYEARIEGTNSATGKRKEPWRWGASNPITYGSYGINGWLYAADDPYAKSSPEFIKRDFASADAVKGSSQVPVFADCIWVDGWPMDIDTPTFTPTASHLETGYYQGGMNTNMGRFWLNRHALKISVSFFDGHAEVVPLADLWTLSWHKNFKPRSDIKLP